MVYVYLIDVSFETGQHWINPVRNPVKCQSRSFSFKWPSSKCIRPRTSSRSSAARCTGSTCPAVWTSAAASQSHSVGSFPRTLSKLFIVSKEHVLWRAGDNVIDYPQFPGDNVIVYPQFLTCEYRVLKGGYQHSHTRVSQILYAAWRVLSYGIYHIIHDQHSTFLYKFWYLPEQLSRYFVALCSSSRSFMSAYFMYAWVFGIIFLFLHRTSCQHVVCVYFFVSLTAELLHLPEPHFLSGGLEPELCRRLL